MKTQREQEAADKLKSTLINIAFAGIILALGFYMIDGKEQTANEPYGPSTIYQVYPEQDATWEAKKKKILADELEKQQAKGYAKAYADALLRDYYKTHGKDSYMREGKKP